MPVIAPLGRTVSSPDLHLLAKPQAHGEQRASSPAPNISHDAVVRGSGDPSDRYGESEQEPRGSSGPTAAGSAAAFTIGVAAKLLLCRIM